jgi:hypothetical protein
LEEATRSLNLIRPDYRQAYWTFYGYRHEPNRLIDVQFNLFCSFDHRHQSRNATPTEKIDKLMKESDGKP